MSTNSTYTHATNKHHQKSKSTHKLPALHLPTPETQHHSHNPILTNAALSRIAKQTKAGALSPQSPSSPASTASSSSYTLSTPGSPICSTPPISPPFRKTKTVSHINTDTNTNARLTPKRSRSRSRPKPKRKLKSKKTKKKPAKNEKFSKTPKTPPRNNQYKHSKLSHTKTRKHQRNSTTQYTHNKTKKRTDAKKTPKTHSRLRLKTTSLSAKRSRTLSKTKKNYYYYSNPNDLFGDKPISRQSSRNRGTLYAKKKKRVRKQKKAHKRIKKKKMSKPLSSRNVTDLDMSDDSIQYIQYGILTDGDVTDVTDREVSPEVSLLDPLELDMTDMDIELDIEIEIQSNTPFLKLSHSLSDGLGNHECELAKKRKKRRGKGLKVQSSKTPKGVSHRARSKSTGKSKKQSQKLIIKKRVKSKKNIRSKKAKKKLKKSVKKQTKTVKKVLNDIETTPKHSRGAMSMDINGINTPPMPSPPVFLPRKISDSFTNRVLSNNKHFTPSVPTSPRFWNTASPRQLSSPATPGMFYVTPDNEEMGHKAKEESNTLRRNTIAMGMGGTMIIDTNTVKKGKESKSKSNYSSLSLSALAHYFQYDTSHETKSVLAVLARMIMELVGEPNTFSVWFKVRPEVCMAIRRNKLRISPILHRGLAISFCVHSMPEQLQNCYDYNDSPLYEESYDECELKQGNSNGCDPYQLTLDLYDESNECTVMNTYDNLDVGDSPKCTDLPSDLNISSSSDEDGDDLKVSISSDGSNHTSHFIEYPSANSSADMEAECDMTHGLCRSNSDVFIDMDVCPDMNYVETFRNENIKHLQSESASFSIDITCDINNEIKSNSRTYEDINDSLYRLPSCHDKSGSDMTIVSVSASNTTLSGHHYGRTLSSNTIANFNSNDTIPVTQIPDFNEGYETVTNSNNTLLSESNASKKMDSLTHTFETDIIVRNVNVPTIEHIKQNMKVRNSIDESMDFNLKNICSVKDIKPSLTSPVNSDKAEIKPKLTDHTTIPDKNYDSSHEIEYDEYDDEEDIIDIQSKSDAFQQISTQLQLSIRSSLTNSIPLHTIQVTTPNATHTEIISHNPNTNSSPHKNDKLSPIEDEFDDLKTETFPTYFPTIITDDSDSENDGFEDEKKENTHRRMPTLTRKNSQKKPLSLSYMSKSQSNSLTKSSARSRSNRTKSTTPTFSRSRNKPALNITMRHRPRSQTVHNFDNGFFNDIYFGGNEPDLYQSIVIDNGSFLSRNISMISPQSYYNNGNEGNIIKFEKPFNKMVSDENGNIFIGTDKYIRYITYNKNDNNIGNKYGKFRKQEKLLYELKYDEHLVSLWNQNGKIYFVTMPYALQDNHYKEYNKKASTKMIEEWSIHLYVVENKKNRQRSINKYEWIPPSVHDKLPYRKLKTFRWKVRGRFIDNFLSMWYDEKYETLITLAECDRLNEPQIIFLNKRNNKGLKKLKIRNNTVSIHGNTNDHDDASNNQHLLIRHKPTKSWLCCISCTDTNDKAMSDESIGKAEEECWIQFKLDRESNKITSSKIIKLPMELRRKKWLSYDEHRDCLIGINRLGIEELLECGFETTIELCVVPRLTKLLQQNAAKQIYNGKRSHKKKKATYKNKRGRSASTANGRFYRKRSHSHKRRK